MKIYRNRKDRKLYTISYVSPRFFTGSWYVATPLWGPGKAKKNIKLTDYELISER